MVRNGDGGLDTVARIEQCLESAVAHATAGDCPPLLARALHYAVFPGGARVRPQLTLAVAEACGGGSETVVDHAAAAVELMHCASLVHDDLPCFDDADTRRGKPSVHALYGEEIAVLVGDALIVEAFGATARGCEGRVERLSGLISNLTAATGPRTGIVAGQAWESEDVVETDTYHCAKTGSLFVGAVSAGALAVGSNPAPWRPLARSIGHAYQMADDLLDAVGHAKQAGKPVGQDGRNRRPNAVRELGVDGALRRLRDTVEEATAAIPPCQGAARLKALLAAQAQRLVPAQLQPA